MRSKEKHHAARALLELQDIYLETEEPDTIGKTACCFNYSGKLEPLEAVQVSASVNQVSESQINSEIQRITENIELKAKVENAKLPQEAFNGIDEKVKYYTGRPSYLTLMTLFHFVEKYIPAGRGNTVMSKFEKLVLVLMRLRLNLLIQDLAYRFNISKSSVSIEYL